MTELTQMLIGDADVGSDTDGATTEVRSPYSGEIVGLVPRGTESQIDTAVSVALDCHRHGTLPAHERAAVLDRAAVSLHENSAELSRLITAESAKPIRTSRSEVARAVDTFRFSAAVARTLAGEVVPLEASSTGEGKLGLTIRVPTGVVAAISPFNFPLNLVAHKVAPAIAAGCPVVLKPASATPLTALRLARILNEECGLRPGWLNVVTCPGSVAEHLATHSDVAMVSFTGSAEVGWRIRSRAPRKKVSLELGNNTPVIVEPGADLELAARKIAATGYAFAGQSCISVQRLYVQRSVYDELLNLLADEVANLGVGDPTAEETAVSSLITPDDTERVRSLVDDALADGAELVHGGTLRADGILEPTLLNTVSNEMAVSATEVFGPVVAVAPYEDLDEAIGLANDTRYGLQAGIFTPELSSAMRAARELRFGGVTINEVPSWRADQMPYGGVGDSGNTKEGPAWAAREMTEERMIAIDG